MSRSAEGFDDLSDHVAGNLVAELKRLRAEVADLRARAIQTTKILNAIECEIDSYIDGAPDRGEAANLANNISSLLQGISLVHGGKL